MKEIREQITVTGFQRSRLFKFLLFPPCFPLSPPVHRNVQRKREINADTRSESFSLQNVCLGKFIHHNSPRIAAINASTSRQHDGHCKPSTSMRKPRMPGPKYQKEPRRAFIASNSGHDRTYTVSNKFVNGRPATEMSLHTHA